MCTIFKRQNAAIQGKLMKKINQTEYVSDALCVPLWMWKNKTSEDVEQKYSKQKRNVYTKN